MIVAFLLAARATHLICCRGERLCRSNELFGRPAIKTYLFSCNSPFLARIGRPSPFDRLHFRRSSVFCFSNLREQRTCERNHHIDRTLPLLLNVACFVSFTISSFGLFFTFFTVHVALAVAAFYCDFRSPSRRLTVTH